MKQQSTAPQGLPLPTQKLPEKLRRYAPTKGNQEKKRRKSGPRVVVPKQSQSGHTVVLEWSQSGPRVVIRIISVIRVIRGEISSDLYRVLQCDIEKSKYKSLELEQNR